MDRKTHLLSTEGSVLIAIDRIERDKRMKANRGLGVFWNHRLAILEDTSQRVHFVSGLSLDKEGMHLLHTTMQRMPQQLCAALCQNQL